MRRLTLPPVFYRVLISIAMGGALLLGMTVLFGPTWASPPVPSRAPAQTLDIEEALAPALRTHTGDGDTVVKEFVPIQDTTVASKPPYNSVPLGGARALLFGTEHDLGITRTFLDFAHLPLPPDALIEQVVLALGIADGSDDAPLAIEVAPSDYFSEGSTTWQHQPATQTPWFVTVIMTRGKWYLYDITPFVQFYSDYLNTRTSDPVRLRIRALEEPASGWKGMWSIEGNRDLAPHVLVAYSPDTTPPTCALDPLPPLIYGETALTGRASDDRAPTVVLEFQARSPGSPWRTIAPLTDMSPQSDVFTATLSTYDILKNYRGKVMYIRCRAHDRAGNVSPWTPAVHTRVYGQPPQIEQVEAPDLIGGFRHAPIRVTFAYPRPKLVRVGWQDLEMRELPDGEWQREPIREGSKVFSPTEGTGTITLNVTYGHGGAQVQYRLRLRDQLDNVSEWHETGPARTYEWRIRAHMNDIRGAPLDVFPRVEPSEWVVRPAEPYTYHIYGWGRHAFTITYATRDRSLMSKGYNVYNHIDMNLPGHVGINESAVRNGDFADGLTGWQTFAHPATVQDPTWIDPGYLTIDLTPTFPRFFHNAVGDIVPFEGRSLLVWHEWKVWQVDYHGQWEALLNVPRMPGAHVARWIVPEPVTDTFHALAIVERDTRPHYQAYLFDWNPQVGSTSFVTVTQTRLTSMDLDGTGRAHLLWWDGHTQEMVYRAQDGNQWREQRLSTSGQRASDVAVLVLDDTVWAFRRDAARVCWHRSTDGGATWANEVCRDFPPLAQNPPQEWVFRAGTNGPFIYDGNTLWAWDGATWAAWGEQSPARLTGCPDGSVRGFTTGRNQGIESTYVVEWDAQGRFLGRREIAHWIRALPRWLWCGHEDFGGYSNLGLARVWRRPQIVPLLAQAIRVPAFRPTLGFLSRVYPYLPAERLVLISSPDMGRAYTLPVHLQETVNYWTYAWADLTPAAGQQVTMTLAISTTVYPFFGDDQAGAAFREIEVRSQPYDVAVRQVVQPLGENQALLRLWIMNRRPVSATQLGLTLAWSAPYTLTRLSTPFLWQGDNRIALDTFSLPPGDTLYITGTLAVTGTVPITGWTRAWITPTVVDMRPSDNAFEYVFFTRPHERKYLPFMLGR